jgi:ATP-GRASP peptide maturase of grasp-with-spasm system
MKNELILICSDESEASTDAVCSWLFYMKKKFLRISSKNVILIKKIIIQDDYEDILFDIDDLEYKLSDFSSYWYRRSFLNFSKLSNVMYHHDGIDLSNEVSTFLEKEYNSLKKYFILKLNKLAKLNRYEDNYINKLEVLSIANKLGINTPKTQIVKNINDLNFISDSYITKSITDLHIRKSNKIYYSLTQNVDINDKDDFFFSLIQQEIKKKFEIRSFYFNNTFYSSAIFSQENTKTELDFRNYDDENPNRVVPYNLPKKLESKLLKLASKLELKSGSFDIIYTTNNLYVLLEVNPVGQFDQVTNPCNYNLYKEIANYL